MAGWVLLDRDFTSSDMWLSEPFTRGQAWVDMFTNANHSPGYFRANGRRINIDRGQIGWSQLTMGKRWQWSRGKIKRFLDELETDHQIIQSAGQYTTIISICNYEKYQAPDKNGETVERTEGDTTNGHPIEQRTGHKQRMIKNSKKKKEPLPDFIDPDLWAEFKRMRVRIKAPMTDEAEKRAIKKIEGFPEEDRLEIITRTIDNCWKGFFSLKGDSKGSGGAAAAWSSVEAQLHDSANASFDEPTRMAIKAIGGLRALSQCNERNLPFKKKEFMNEYQG